MINICHINTSAILRRACREFVKRKCSVQGDEYNSHDSLQVCLTEGTGHQGTGQQLLLPELLPAGTSHRGNWASVSLLSNYPSSVMLSTEVSIIPG